MLLPQRSVGAMLVEDGGGGGVKEDAPFALFGEKVEGVVGNAGWNAHGFGLVPHASARQNLRRTGALFSAAVRERAHVGIAYRGLAVDLADAAMIGQHPP